MSQTMGGAMHGAAGDRSLASGGVGYNTHQRYWTKIRLIMMRSQPDSLMLLVLFRGC